MGETTRALGAPPNYQHFQNDLLARFLSFLWLLQIAQSFFVLPLFFTSLSFEASLTRNTFFFTQSIAEPLFWAESLLWWPGK